MKHENQGGLTSGPILSTLIKLALPIMASAFLGTVYNITDMAWVGLLGADTVAGVGVGGMYMWLFSGVGTITRMGGQVMAAQSLGKGNHKDAREYARSAIQLVILIGIILGAICYLFTDQMVGFFALKEERALEAAVSYFRIACGLCCFSLFNVTINGLYTAQGDSKTPFLANLVGLSCNMILDPLLILGFHMNEVGAAVATIVSQIIVSLIMILAALRSQAEENILRNLHLNHLSRWGCYSRIFKIGIPASVQSMVYCGISMLLTRMMSGFGAAVVAVNRVGGQIESLSWNTAEGFGAAINAFTGQNYGAGKMNRIKEGYRISCRTVFGWGLFIMAAFMIFPHQISSIFFHEEYIIRESVAYLFIIGLSQAFMCVELMTVGALSGMGLTRLCSIISVTITASRLPIALWLSQTALGVNGIWIAMSLTSIVKGILFFCVFHRITAEKKQGDLCV